MPSVAFELRSIGFFVLGAVLVALVALVLRARSKDGRRARADVSSGNGLAERRARDEELPRAADATGVLPFDLSRALSVPPPAPTRHPIVLAQGYFGFGGVGVSRVRPEYFRGVRGALESLGYEVHVVRVAPAAGVALRAEQFVRQVHRISAERVNVIAHSMGGLDARYAIARLGLAERVASLTTIGTPHRGTPVADRSALLVGEWRRLRRALHALGANVDGLYDLTTERMEAFNRAVPDAPGVTYASVVGSVAAHRNDVHALLAPGHKYLARLAGPNDGLVPAESQRWGRVLGEVDADHWAQIGWSQDFDAGRFYAAIAGHLAELGH